MPNSKTLAQLQRQASELLTLQEAAEWLSANKAEFEVTKAPVANTLKKAHYDGRLVAINKAKLLLTNVAALREFMAAGYSEYGGRHAAKLKAAKTPLPKEAEKPIRRNQPDPGGTSALWNDLKKML